MKTTKEAEKQVNEDEVEFKPLLEKIEFSFRLIADVYTRCYRSPNVTLDGNGILTIISIVLSSSVNVIHQLRVPLKLSSELNNSAQISLGAFYVLHGGPFITAIRDLVKILDVSIEKGGEDKYKAYAKYQHEREILISNTSCKLADDLIRIYNTKITTKI